MIDQKVFYSLEQKQAYVTEVLAYARYDMLMRDDHKNFMYFIYACLRQDAEDLKDYSEQNVCECDEPYTFDEALSQILYNIRHKMYDSSVETVRDYICRAMYDSFTFNTIHYPKIFHMMQSMTTRRCHDWHLEAAGKVPS